MENISAIVAHFKQRIEQWSKANDNQAISPDDVLLVIKATIHLCYRCTFVCCLFVCLFV
jgi:hypothetical protein